MEALIHTIDRDVILGLVADVKRELRVTARHREILPGLWSVVVKTKRLDDFELYAKLDKLTYGMVCDIH